MKEIKLRVKLKLKEKNIRIKEVEKRVGISRSHFSKVLNGERPPNEKLVEFIAELLDEEPNKIRNDFLISQNEYKKQLIHNSELGEDSKKGGLTSTKHHKTRLVSAFLFIALLVVSTIFVFKKEKTTKTYSPPPKLLTPLYNEDNTSFIADITFPDGEYVAVNSTFEKVWRIKNTGNIVWKDRTLRRETPREKEICDSITQINIPTTPPGEVVDLSVDFKAPEMPGSCKVYWKMYDENGNQTFPDAHPLYLLVNVVATIKNR